MVWSGINEEGGGPMTLRTSWIHGGLFTAVLCGIALIALLVFSGGDVASQGVAGTRSEDIDLLARVIEAEAQGEPYIGKVAVAAVILNRVRHPEFPNTLSGVIFQPHAFESVTNGLIWRRTPTEESRRAAIDALNGWDPTYGSIFFWNPYKPVSPWIWSRPVAVQYGNHVFAH